MERNARQGTLARRLVSRASMCAVVMVAGLSGCTSQQLYGAGQAWQRNECFKLPDATQRERCLASTARSYEEYQRQSGAASPR